MAVKIFICFVFSITLCAAAAALRDILFPGSSKRVTLPRIVLYCASGAGAACGIASIILCAYNFVVAAAVLSALAFIADVVMYIHLYYRVYFDSDEISILYFIKKYTYDISAVSNIRLRGKNTEVSACGKKFLLFFVLENFPALRELCENSISKQEALEASDTQSEDTLVVDDIDDVPDDVIDDESDDDLDYDFDDDMDDLDDLDDASDSKDAESPKPSVQSTPDETNDKKFTSSIIGTPSVLICVGVFIVILSLMLCSLMLPLLTQDDLSQTTVTIAATHVKGNDIIIKAQETSRLLIVSDYKKTMASPDAFLSLVAGETITISLAKSSLPIDMTDSDAEVYAISRLDGRIYMTPDKALDIAASEVLFLRYSSIIMTLLSIGALVYLLITSRRQRV